MIDLCEVGAAPVTIPVELQGSSGAARGGQRWLQQAAASLQLCWDHHSAEWGRAGPRRGRVFARNPRLFGRVDYASAYDSAPLKLV